jgi:riboflavin synthase
MFTGIIEEIGHISAIKFIPNGKQLNIVAKTVLTDTKIGDSISVNGVCLTVIQTAQDNFWAEAVGETLKKTTVNLLKTSAVVNLERALQLQSRLGGHIVQGHVNAVGKITNITKLGDNYLLEFNIPDDIRKYIINEGSICIDGISLTVAEIRNNIVKISVIPHTWQNTNLQYRKIGDKINIETDVLAKYIENMLKFSNNTANNTLFSDEWFKRMGYK